MASQRQTYNMNNSVDIDRIRRALLDEEEDDLDMSNDLISDEDEEEFVEGPVGD